MSGNAIGGGKARDANLAKDPEFYKKIGALGGAKGHTGGFASENVGKDGLTGRERASKVGKVGGVIGGTKSRRTKA